LPDTETSLPPQYVVAEESTDDSGEASGYKEMKHLLAVRPMPDGVFCYNDTIATGAMRAILDAGLRIPQDIAIVGCGDFAYDDLLRIPLTSIDQDS
jgi:LacI family transcriptional regulator